MTGAAGASGSTHAALSQEASHGGYASGEVPDEAQGSGWRVFFIVAGSLCGLPTFILSASVFGALGLQRGLTAVLVGTSVSAVLGASAAFAGSRGRAGLAVMADRTFGSTGAALVKLIIALSLVGWFGVNIGVLGATAAAGLTRMLGATVQPLAIGVPACVAIAAVTIVGARGLERLGLVLVPVALLVLIGSVLLVLDKTAIILTARGSDALSFGQAVSAVVGSYVVGIVIQPDYGRFVRRPAAAAIGAGAALGAFYPLVLALASFASLALGAPELVTAMILLGFGLPALAVLLLGAWIDASACLYSASLSLVNQFPRLRMAWVVLAVALIGIALVLVGAYSAFIPFLVALGISLPPLAAVLVICARDVDPLSDTQVAPPSGMVPLAAWALGTAVGALAVGGSVSLTQLPTLDSILGAVVTLQIGRFASRRTTTTSS